MFNSDIVGLWTVSSAECNARLQLSCLSSSDQSLGDPNLLDPVSGLVLLARCMLCERFSTYLGTLTLQLFANPFCTLWPRTSSLRGYKPSVTDTNLVFHCLLMIANISAGSNTFKIKYSSVQESNARVSRGMIAFASPNVRCSTLLTGLAIGLWVLRPRSWPRLVYCHH